MRLDQGRFQQGIVMETMDRHTTRNLKMKMIKVLAPGLLSSLEWEQLTHHIGLKGLRALSTGGRFQ